MSDHFQFKPFTNDQFDAEEESQYHNARGFQNNQQQQNSKAKRQQIKNFPQKQINSEFQEYQKFEIKPLQKFKKISYKERINSLGGNQKQLMNASSEQIFDEHQNGRNSTPLTREEQLRRNRQSAKNSRERRKQYLDALEVRNNQLLRKIEDLNIRLKQAEEERDRLKEDNRSYMKTFLTAKNEAFQNLNAILTKNGKKSSDKLSEQIENLCSRYGAAGSQRVAATDYFMKQIIEILLSDGHKYIVDCVVNDSGLFGMKDWSSMDDQFCKILKINKELRLKLSRSYKSEMMREFQTFKTVSQKFYDSYRVVQYQAKVIQKIFQKIIVEFNDVCLAQLLLFIENNKYSKELKRIRADWARSVEEPSDLIGNPRKVNQNFPNDSSFN